MIGVAGSLRSGLAAALVFGLLALVGCSTSSMADSSKPQGEHHRISITIERGEVVDHPGRVVVTAGDQVELHVSADVTDEVHVHGYDVAGDVAPGKPATVTFVADIPGVFEAELEENHQRILELQVR